MSNTNPLAMYNLSINQTENLIATVGRFSTVLVRGPMGSGKSSILKMLAKRFPNHLPIYLDGTTLVDSGDLFLCKYSDSGDSFEHVPKSMLGLHLNKPVILMVDEIGKMARSAQLAVRRLMLERKYDAMSLHPDSMVFATTNLSAEGVGDILPTHALNSMTVVDMRGSDNMEFIEWGIDNGVDPTMLGFAKETPHMFHGFHMYENPDENPYIFHPRSTRTAFVTGRSLKKASDILKQRHLIDEVTQTAALIGTIGACAALDLAAFIALADQLPKMEDIKSNPMMASVPKDSAAICMVVYRTLATIERSWAEAWLTYMDRLPKEAQGLFVSGVRAANYSRRDCIVQNKKYQDWCLNNNYMFASDTK